MTGVKVLAGNEAPCMATRTTLRLGGRVLGEVLLEDADAAAALPAIASRLGGTLVSLGAGSNILAKDGELALVAVRNATPPTVTLLEETAETAVVRASGSVRLPVLLGRAAAWDLAGLEGLSGIPGTVGGAVAMNAGSYGQSVADTLLRVTVVTQTGQIRTVTKDELQFRYRHLSLPVHGWWLALSADFCLQRAAPGTVRTVGRDNIAKKKATQPVHAASAGCVFKNPAPDISAGKLLDKAGFKGKRCGKMAFSTLHANFLINEGGGRADEALELLETAREAVQSRYGIHLETEVRIWG